MEATNKGKAKKERKPLPKVKGRELVKDPFNLN